MTDSTDWEISKYNLMAVVSQISEENVGDSKHSIIHMNTKSRKSDVMKSRTSSTISEESSDSSKGNSNSSISNINGGDNTEEWQWFLYNDFAITPSSAEEAGTFEEWRHPCMICYRRIDYEKECLTSSLLDIDTSLPVVPGSVLSLASLSQTPSIRLPPVESLPGKGDLIAFDGEFVSVEVERSKVNSEGKRVVSEEGRQVLARSSLVDGGEASNTSRPTRILADDCILQTEPVVDYVTRFSGLAAEDLSFLSSRFSVVSNRTAYLKLRFFLDRGCLFVGHGLQKDFETANVFVPPEQIRDTVELWRLPNQRKVSLRFLAAYVIKEYIQGEIHDSIEDAKTALLLYRHYETLLQTKGKAHITQILNELYSYGNSCNWIATDEI
jgi:PAB-dependent poly(A)-specific ribonuclease subunit 2